jgi:hypothetical protein
MNATIAKKKVNVISDVFLLDNGLNFLQNDCEFIIKLRKTYAPVKEPHTV